jgi:hypothetical protein
MGVFAYKNSGVHNVTNSFSFQRLIFEFKAKSDIEK